MVEARYGSDRGVSGREIWELASLFGLESGDMFSFEWIPGILPVSYAARIMHEVLKTVIEKLLIGQHAGRAAGVRTVKDDLLLGIEHLQCVTQAFEVNRPGDTFGAEHRVIQTIDQFEVYALIQLCL
jgi:hypothetical protein